MTYFQATGHVTVVAESGLMECLRHLKSHYRKLYGIELQAELHQLLHLSMMSGYMYKFRHSTGIWHHATASPARPNEQAKALKSRSKLLARRKARSIREPLQKAL